MPKPTFTYKRRVYCLTFTMLVCLFGAVAARMYVATAQNNLELTLTPSPLTEKGKITVKHPTDQSFQFKADKFEQVTDPNGLVRVTNPTEANAAFEVEPIKSGKTTLIVKYKDDQIELSGTIDVVVPHKEISFLNVPASGAIRLLSGQQFTLTPTVVSVEGQPMTAPTVVYTNKTPTVISDVPVGNNLTVTAKNVTRTATATIGMTVNGVAAPDISIQVTEAIKQIKVERKGVVVNKLEVMEGEGEDLTVSLIGVADTIYKPSEFPNFTVTIESVSTTLPLITVSKTSDDTYRVLGGNLPVQTQNIEMQVVFSLPGGQIGVMASEQTEPEPARVKVTLIPKIGFIRLTTSSPTLTQNGRVNISAEVITRSGLPHIPIPEITFTLRDSDAPWATLVKQGNQATVVWRNPTLDEIKRANNNQLVPRPPEVVITASATPPGQSQAVTSTLSLSMGEIRGFDVLRVKLNVMDNRTASDLYGKVTSEEYYVLTVRLFNDLKDQRLGQFTGESILAYSSSIEVAVGLEKKFDNDTDSYFPSVISRGAAKRIADKTARQAQAMAESRVDAEIAAATRAQTELTAAINEQYESRKSAINAVNNAVELKTRAEQLTTIARRTQMAQARRTDVDAAIRNANDAITNSNNAMVSAMAALERARVAEEKVEQLRRSAAKAAISQMSLTRDISNFLDPDTAINDGKWHPVSGRDLNRLYPPPVPEETPVTTQDNGGLGLLSPITAASLEKMEPERPSQIPVASPDSEGQDAADSTDPPCVGVITYRPYTFEMMVNTVDRRDGRSWRTKVFKVLDFVGTSTSFVTSVAVPGSSSDLPLGLEKYRNLLIPGLERLWPSPKEQQRQNIVSQAMKEIEEIPFGSDITRVIFIPKRTIHGLLRGHDVRISEICPYYFKIQVAIVTKSGAVQQGTIVR